MVTKTDITNKFANDLLESNLPEEFSSLLDWEPRLPVTISEIHFLSFSKLRNIVTSLFKALLVNITSSIPLMVYSSSQNLGALHLHLFPFVF